MACKIMCESDAGGTVLDKEGPYAADVRIFGPGGPLFRRDLRFIGGTIKRMTGQNGYVTISTL